ncbi:MAG: hypothetical protein JW384_04214 [Nitrosomonadaceae bacterium]|nr:hypothetical protein [Nitrosomonadaceae bacterium]
MENTTNTTVRIPSFARGSVKAWRMIARSEGERGYKGKTKQYVIRVVLDTDGTFTVTKSWGRGEAHRTELTSQTIGVFRNLDVASNSAYSAMNEKIGKYELTEQYEADALNV